MPVMKKLTVGGVTYDTVGEASVTQVQASGTKIATVSIDGTSTDIYAPSGGSSVEPATAAPSMDGTAAVGSSAKYAREDHVHPTDTSRQAALVSGTNIKTINGDSLLGSGNLAVGGSVTMEDTAVDAAVGAAWPLHNVTITLTNPDSSSSFTCCTIYELTSSSSEGLQIGSIDSPTGSTTVSIDSFSYGIRLSLRGSDVYPGTSTISGDIEETGIYDGFSAYMQYSVAGSGTITIDGISWND